MNTISSLNQQALDLFASARESAEAFVAISYDFTFLNVNPIAEKFYKKKSNELIGNKVKAIFPELWSFGPFKSAQGNVAAKRPFVLRYHSPFSDSWVQLSGIPYDDFYTFTYKTIDHKSALNDELRSEMKRKKS